MSKRAFVENEFWEKYEVVPYELQMMVNEHVSLSMYIVHVSYLNF